MRELTAGLAAMCFGLGAAPAWADPEEKPFPGTFSGTVGFTTNYMFRGQTQTQDDGAIFGILGWAHDSGVYVGLFGANVDLGDGVEDTDTNLEIDYWIGYANSYKWLDYDLSWLYYTYPGSNTESFDYYEFQGVFGHDFGPLALKGSVNYTPDYAGKIGRQTALTGRVTVPLPFLPLDATIDAAIGYTHFETVDDFTDWDVGLGFMVKGFHLDFRYYGSDLGVNDPTSVYAGYREEVVDNEFAFTVSRSF